MSSISTTTSVLDPLNSSPSTAQRVWRVQVETKDAVGMPLEIFVHQFDPSNSSGIFCAVASVPQLSMTPANTPAPDNSYFRLKKYCIDFKNADDAAYYIAQIDSDIQQLVSDLNALENLTPEPVDKTFA